MRVTIVQRRLTHYRVRLFETLRSELEASGVGLDVLIGDARPDERLKRDSGELEWATRVPTRYILGGRACWQSLGRSLAGTNLVVLTQENSLLANHAMLFSPRKRRIAFWGHGANMQAANAESCRERYKRWTTRQVDWWFVYSKISADAVLAAGFPGERITVLNNAFDTAELRRELDTVSSADVANLRRTLGIDHGMVGVYVGSLYSDKRLDFLIEAARAIHDVSPEFHLLIVGDGPERDKVRTWSHTHRWVHWAGTRYGHEKAAYLTLADVMVSPGATGLAVLDSFVCGLPLVTTNCGTHGPEIAYVENGENGVITDNTCEGFVRGVRRVLQDAAFRDRLIQGCKTAASYYTVENMARNFRDGIMKALHWVPEATKRPL